MSLRLAGLLWFAWIPATLALILRLPLGEGWSLLAAALIIAIHRWGASRFVRRHALERCLWCGGAPLERRLVLLEGLPELSTCLAEETRLDRFLSFCGSATPFLRLLILGPVAAYFLLGWAESITGWAPLELETRRLLFRAPIALGVVGVALFHRWAAARRPPRFPFPLHNLALLGVRWTLWIFLSVGFAWLWISASSLLSP